MRDRVQEATDALLEILLKDERFREGYQRHLMYGLIYGRQGFGKDLRAKEKLMCGYYSSVPTNTGLGEAKRDERPHKVCTYRAPVLSWYGPKQWVIEDLTVKGANPDNNMAVFRGKRFIGLSEPTETEQLDNDSLKKFTGDEWVETKTLNRKSSEWKPLGKVFVMSGKPLKINDEKSKEMHRGTD